MTAYITNSTGRAAADGQEILYPGSKSMRDCNRRQHSIYVVVKKASKNAECSEKCSRPKYGSESTSIQQRTSIVKRLMLSVSLFIFRFRALELIFGQHSGLLQGPTSGICPAPHKLQRSMERKMKK
jgi:hypothetical protein